MKESLQQKLVTLCQRYDDVGAMLSDPDVMGDQQRFRSLSKEYAQLEPLAWFHPNAASKQVA